MSRVKQWRLLVRLIEDPDNVTDTLYEESYYFTATNTSVTEKVQKKLSEYDLTMVAGYSLFKV